MSNMILVDFDTAVDPIIGPATKEFLIEYLVRHPETMVAVLNSNPGSKDKRTKEALRGVKFPFDTVSGNPLTDAVPQLIFKTMFALRLREHDEHVTVLVLDRDVEAQKMWSESGVSYVYAPTR